MRDDEQVLRETEVWFVRHGLPYFADGLRTQVEAGLARKAVAGVGALTVLAGLLAGLLVEADFPTRLLAGMLVAGVVVVGYGLARLRVWPMARWALGHTFDSLGLLFPLATRALPLLLLFMTFLFINTEVWQVATTMDHGVLWVAVLLFAAFAIGFLLVRLPEEVDRADDAMGGVRLLRGCQGTPVEEVAERYADDDVAEIAQVRGYEAGNLVFVLLVTQAVQVLLLSLAVYLFFVIFGAVAINEHVMLTWLGKGEVHWLIPGWHVISLELLQVSTFLAAFAGLYFTVYAVTDETYRTQFFGSLLDDLQRAIAVRAVYRLLRRSPEPER
ncbi:MAG: hypothetical protein J7518_01865 [Nocardioidaceae bacterium]|nr:hypothetical protein [Nocardioidaceae bacterium]